MVNHVHILECSYRRLLFLAEQPSFFGGIPLIGYAGKNKNKDYARLVQKKYVVITKTQYYAVQI